MSRSSEVARHSPPAEITGRVCYGMELDPKYVDVVVQRWQSLSGQEAVLDGAGDTFDQSKHRAPEPVA